MFQVSEKLKHYIKLTGTVKLQPKIPALWESVIMNVSSLSEIVFHSLKISVILISLSHNPAVFNYIVFILTDFMWNARLTMFKVFIASRNFGFCMNSVLTDVVQHVGRGRQKNHGMLIRIGVFQYLREGHIKGFQIPLHSSPSTISQNILSYCWFFYRVI